ncbi:alpha/beta hydrolase [Streptomyces orinoci]|uniref:Alpha/beta fold hydrolase n=1 Tax=Streptomyces orinoci TaxID=67339 RepID=A0ABV3JWV6_STRON|nr:alpha/beta fold hydrolase [Streptomyces orinoci]
MLLRKAATTAATVVGAGAAVLAAGRYAGDAALKIPPDRPLPGEERCTVHGADTATVTLSRTAASVRPGTYALVGKDLHAIVGPPVAEVAHPPDRVVRHLRRLVHGALDPGTKVWLSPQLYPGNPRDALGLDHSDVQVEGELGPLPAWFLPGPRDTWVITVHGLGATRRQAMALLPFLHRLRLPVLAPALRGDPGAPPALDGINRLGAEEWHDVDAAIGHAVRNGARRVVLHGWSTGATMALLAALDSPLSHRISGLVLDSPVLDWQATLRALARHRVPRALVPYAVRAARHRAGLDPGLLLRAGEPDKLLVPTLILHGPDDALAPWERSRELAERRPGLVTLRSVREAPHAAAWNADPHRYEEALRRFLTPLM